MPDGQKMQVTHRGPTYWAKDVYFSTAMKGQVSLFSGVIPDKRGDEVVIKDGIKTCYPANDGEPYVLSKRDGMVYVLVENRFVKDEEYLSAEKLAKVTPTQWKQRANYFARQIQKKYRNDEMTFMECDKRIKELIERTHIQIAIYSGVLSGEAIKLMTRPMLRNELVLRGLKKSGTRSELEQRLKDTIEDDDEVDESEHECGYASETDDDESGSNDNTDYDETEHSDQGYETDYENSEDY